MSAASCALLIFSMVFENINQRNKREEKRRKERREQSTGFGLITYIYLPHTDVISGYVLMK